MLNSDLKLLHPLKDSLQQCNVHRVIIIDHHKRDENYDGSNRLGYDRQNVEAWLFMCFVYTNHYKCFLIKYQNKIDKIKSRIILVTI